MARALSEDLTTVYLESKTIGSAVVSSLGHLVTPKGQEGLYLAAYIRAEAGDLPISFSWQSTCM